MQNISLKRVRATRTIRTLAAVVVITMLGISACGILPDKVDETKNWTVEQLYTDAKNDLDNGNYESSIKTLEKIESRFPFGAYAQQAQMQIPYAYYKQGDQEQALAAVQRFIKLHPNHENLDYIFYLRGLINFNDQLSLLNAIAKQDMTERDPKAAREAFDSFKLLVTRFPASKYTPDALLRMKFLINTMAQYDVHVAKYYFRRGAYLAAANRAQSAIKDYPEAPAIQEALYVLYQSYDKMGLTVLRDDVYRIYVKNYPAAYFGVPMVAAKAPWWKIWH